MKRKKWLWIWAIVILLVAIAGTVTLVCTKQESSKNKVEKINTSQSTSGLRTNATTKMINMKSGQEKVVNGLQIDVKSISKTDYKAYSKRNVVKVKMSVKNTTKKDLYVVASAPHGAFDTGFAKSDSWNLAGLATDSITDSHWTSSVASIANDKGKLSDDHLISNQLQKKSGVILGIGANYKYMCWKLTPGQSVSGTAYGAYDQDSNNPDQLPVLKVNPDQIGVDKSTVDIYKDEYQRQATADTNTDSE